MIALLLSGLSLADDRVGDDRESQDQLDSLEVLPPLRFATDGSDSGGAQRELAGLVVGGRERPNGIELLRLPGDRIVIPLRALARDLGVTVVEEPAGLRVDTPLGPARFDLGEYRDEQGEIYLPLTLLARRLALVARFDDSAYALLIDPAWPIGGDLGRSAGSSPEQPIRPELLAPGLDLARLRGELSAIHDDRGERYTGRVEAGGRLGPGAWQVRAQNSGIGSTRLHDYHWRIRRDGFAGLLGHQVVGVHSVLPGFDLTGAQIAWTNAPDRLYSSAQPDLLVADRPGPVRTLRGEGPPGGFAELVIEGRVIDRQRIPLDGVFEFVSVPIPVGQARIEVLLYERAIAGAPSGRIDFSGRAGDRLLGAGEMVLHGGIGQDGNPLDELRPDRGGGGFLRARRGFSERFTAEAAVQASGYGEHGLVAADAELGPVGTVSGAYAHGNGASAWLASLEGGRGPVFWRGLALERDAGFLDVAGGDLSERSGEVGWRRWPHWEVSVVARQRRQEGATDIDYVKPAARWRPLSGLFVQARPDYEGHYVYDGQWQPHRHWRVAARRDRRTDEVRVEHQLAEAWLLSAASTRDRDLERRRDSLIASWQAPTFAGWRAEAGVLRSEGRSGFLARAGKELLPGVQFRFEALRDPLYSGMAAGGDTVASLSVLFDLGRAGGRFTRGGAVRADTGSIGGAIAASAGSGSSRLEGIVVRVDGQPRTRTDAAGRFHVGGLRAGVYRVELDEEGLPMELVSRGDGYWAEVAAGASTTVKFAVELRLGVAGRVRAVAMSLAGMRVDAVMPDGRIATSAVVDEAGWYRLDGLPPGSYRLRLFDAAGAMLAERELALVDDFVFEQDFQLAPAVAAPGSTP